MDCTEENISNLKAQCLTILEDISGTLTYAKSIEEQAWSDAQKAVEPGFKCLKGVYDILKAAAKDCNPASGAPDPVACAETIIGIPDTVSDCDEAVTFILSAIEKYQLAAQYYGAAEVAFGDQNGYEIAEQLANCEEYTCRDGGRGFSDYAIESKRRSEKNADELTKYKYEIEERRNKLKQCDSDHFACVETDMPPTPDLQSPNPIPSPSLPK